MYTGDLNADSADFNQWLKNYRIQEDPPKAADDAIAESSFNGLHNICYIDMYGIKSGDEKPVYLGRVRRNNISKEDALPPNLLRMNKRHEDFTYAKPDHDQWCFIAPFDCRLTEFNLGTGRMNDECFQFVDINGKIDTSWYPGADPLLIVNNQFVKKDAMLIINHFVISRITEHANLHG